MFIKIILLVTLASGDVYVETTVPGQLGPLTSCKAEALAAGAALPSLLQQDVRLKGWACYPYGEV